MADSNEVDKARERQLRRRRHQGVELYRPPWWRVALTVLFLLAIVAVIVVMLNQGTTVPIW